MLNRILIFLSTIYFGSCVVDNQMNVPHEKKWGIYILDIESEEVDLIVSANDPFNFLSLNKNADRFAFSRKINGNSDEDEEIFVMDLNGNGLTRVTDNDFMDVYPCWSPEDSALVFLSSRSAVLNLDLYMIKPDGSQERKFFDSGSHDADVHWNGNLITFTANYGIWTIESDGSSPAQITLHPNAGEWGAAPYPMGDFDPRLNSEGNKIAFSRMIDNQNPHGGYDIYTVDLTSFELTNLTNTGYTQGLANWSTDGDQVVYEVAAIGSNGVFDIYVSNAAGTENINVTPDYFPENFLCHSPMFYDNNSKIIFLGEWYD
jgi:Tol biopolymer transport system component